MGGNRFWEFYLVRYLLGTIFGVVILFFLVTNYNNEISSSFFLKLCDGNKSPCANSDTTNLKASVENLLYETTYVMNKSGANVMLELVGKGALQLEGANKPDVEVKQTGFSILAAVILSVSGFLYMYFSSMVILVLHGLRVVFFDLTDISKKDLKEDLKSPLNFKLKILNHLQKYINRWLIIFTIFSIIARSLTNINTIAWNHIFSIMILVSVLSVFLSKASNIKKFYMELSIYRARSGDGKPPFKLEKINLESAIEINIKTTDKGSATTAIPNDQFRGNQEYIESYRHLREHGNAFGIIVCEILFAFWLVAWNFSFWAIFYWSLIGFIAWILGSYLEVFRDSDTKKI